MSEKIAQGARHNCALRVFWANSKDYMRLLLATTLLLSLSCSKNAPVVDVKKQEVISDPHTIDESMALRTLMSDPGNFDKNIETVLRLRKASFNFTHFWNNLRYPNYNIFILDSKKLSQLDRIGQASCDKHDASSYVQFLEYLGRKAEFKEIHFEIIKNISNYLELCRVSLPPSQLEETLKTYKEIIANLPTHDKNLQFLKFIKILTRSESLEIKKILENQLTQYFVSHITKSLKESNDINAAVDFSISLKRIHPYNSQLNLYPIKQFIMDAESLISIGQRINFQDFERLVQYSHESVLNNNNFSNFYAFYSLELKKHFININNRTKEFYEYYLDSAAKQLELFKSYNPNINSVLKEIDLLASHFDPSLDEIAKDVFSITSAQSVVATTSLFKSLKKDSLRYISLPLENDTTTEVANLFFKARLSEKMLNAREHSNTICEKIGTTKITKLSQVDTNVTCYILETNQQTLTRNRPLVSSFFSVLKIDGVNLVLKKSENKLGILDLSSDKIIPREKSPQKDESSNAIGLPLVFGFKIFQRTINFEKDSFYYMNYHYIAQEAQDGMNTPFELKPSQGFPGGSVELKINNEFPFTFISVGGPGQLAPTAVHAGIPYQAKFDFTAIDLWLSDVLDISYFMDESYQKESNIKRLFKAAKRNDENELMVFVDLQFINTLPERSQIILENSLNKLNTLRSWNCSDKKCMVKNATDEAIVELQRLYAANDYQSIIKKMKSNYISERAINGRTFEQGENGDDGEIIIPNNFID